MSKIISNKTQKNAQNQDISLILVRHAKALHRDKARARGIKDSMRPLTRKGIEKFLIRLRSQENHPVYKKLGQTSVIFHSTFLRAIQTAQLIQDFLRISQPDSEDRQSDLQLRTIGAVTPQADPKRLLNWLKTGLLNRRVLVVVSHEPFISNFLNLAFRKHVSGIEIKKGDLVHIRFKKLNNKIEFIQYKVLSFPTNGAHK